MDGSGRGRKVRAQDRPLGGCARKGAVGVVGTATYFGDRL